MERERRELDRLAAFSDGVFAIAITLLVLNLEVPDVPRAELDAALSELSGDSQAYVIGFAVMGLFWYGHHKLFAGLERSSGQLVLVNMLLLALITLMPFTTDLIGRYDDPLAVTLYATNVGIALLLDGLTDAVARGVAWGSLAGALARALVFFVSIPVAYLVSPNAAEWFWLALIVVALGGRRLERRRT